MKPKESLRRWTINQVVIEFGVTANKFRVGCRVHGIESGDDNRYSTRQVAEALFKIDALEKKAKEARWKGQIDESAHSRIKREELEAKLIRTDLVKETFSDLVATYVRFIRHSKLSESDKKSMIKQLHEVRITETR